MVTLKSERSQLFVFLLEKNRIFLILQVFFAGFVIKNLIRVQEIRS